MKELNGQGLSVGMSALALIVLFVIFVQNGNRFTAQQIGPSGSTVCVHVDDEPPTANDDVGMGYVPGCIWIDTAADTAYTAISVDDDAAAWSQIDAAGGGGSGHTIRDEGVDRADRTYLGFDGAGVSCGDDTGADETTCTIPGGGSGVEIQEGDTTKSAAATIIDYGPGFDVAESPTNEANVTLDMTEYLVDLVTEIEGVLGIANGGTGATTAAAARTALDVDQAGTDNSTDVTLAGARDYISISGQIITRGVVDLSDDTNAAAGAGITFTGDTISADLGTAVDISDETNLACGAGCTLTGDSLSIDVVDISSGSNLTVTEGIALVLDELSATLGTAITSDEITDGEIVYGDLDFANTPADEECVTIETATGNFESQACGAGGAATDLFQYRAGNSDRLHLAACGGHCVFSGSSSTTLAANEIYATWIYIGGSDFYNEFVFEVKTAGSAGEDARVGIYENNTDYNSLSDNGPGALAVDCGTVAVDSTGVKAVTCSSTELTGGGLYWLAIVSEASTVAVHKASGTDGGIGGVVGGLLQSNPNRWLWGFSDGHTCGAGCSNALPNPFPSASPTILHTVTPGLPFRFAISPT